MRLKITWTEDGERKEKSFNTEATAYEHMATLWGKGVRDAKIVGSKYYE